MTDESGVEGVVSEEVRSKVEGILKDVTDTMERNDARRHELINEPKDGGHKDIIQELVKQMGGKVAKTYDSNRKAALLWLESDPASRPYVFLTVSELKVCNTTVAILATTAITLKLPLLTICHQTGQVPTKNRF